MNTQSIRRSVFAMLLVTPLLVAPLSVLAQTTPTNETASPVPRQDFRPGKIQYVLTPEQLQAIISSSTNLAAEPTVDEPLSDVIVSVNAQTSLETKSSNPIAVRRCGLTSVVWLIEHPVEGWRVLTPIAADSELDACLKPPLAALPASP